METKTTSSFSSFNETKSGMSSKAQFLLLFITSFYVGIQLIANVCAGKVLALPFGLYVAGAAAFFPLVGISQDIISNCFGSSIMKKTALTSIIMNIVLALLATLIVIWPGAVFFTNSDAYSTVLSQSIRLVASGLVALWFSTMVNSLVLQKIKRKQVENNKSTTDRKGIFCRTYISSIPSVILDSIIFNTLSWLGNMAFSQILVMIGCQIAIKLIVELVLQIPISTALIPHVVKATGMDAIDDGSEKALNPFKI